MFLLYLTIHLNFYVHSNSYIFLASISEAELLGMKDKTNRHLRLRELLLEHSTASNLIVM